MTTDFLREHIKTYISDYETCVLGKHPDNITCKEVNDLASRYPTDLRQMSFPVIDFTPVTEESDFGTSSYATHKIAGLYRLEVVYKHHKKWQSDMNKHCSMKK